MGANKNKHLSKQSKQSKQSKHPSRVTKKGFQTVTYAELRNLPSTTLNRYARLWSIYPCGACEPYTDKELISILRRYLHPPQRVAKSRGQINREYHTCTRKVGKSPWQTHYTYTGKPLRTLPADQRWNVIQASRRKFKKTFKKELDTYDKHWTRVYKQCYKTKRQQMITGQSKTGQTKTGQTKT